MLCCGSRRTYRGGIWEPPALAPAGCRDSTSTTASTDEAIHFADEADAEPDDAPAEPGAGFLDGPPPPVPIETLCSTEPGWNLRYYVYALLTCGKSGPLDAAFATLHTLAVHHVETDAASPYNGLARVALRELAKQRTWGQ